MKLSSVVLNNYQVGVNTLPISKAKFNSVVVSPVSLVSGADTVSFKGDSAKLFINDLRELPNLPCACCGKDMLQNSRVNDFLNRKIYYPAYQALQILKDEKIYDESTASKEMKEAYEYLFAYSKTAKKLSVSDILTKRSVKDFRRKLSPEVSACFDELREMSKLVAHNSEYMIKEIEKLKPDFQKIDRRIFNELKRLAHTYPEETFYDILNKPDINKYYLRNLEQKQISLLNRVEKTSKSAPAHIRKAIIEEVEKAKVVFKEESPRVFHKRGRVISSFHENLDVYKDNPNVQKVLKIISHLPDSKTDVDAFMIKGAQKNSNAIVEILVGRQRNTFEHVKPHHRIGDNGPNSIYNYIGLCGKCNGERQRIEYDIFVKKHPEMIRNSQIQVNRVIDFINRGILTGYDKYPQEIKKALDIESKGKIDVNIDKFDIAKAKTNRSLRQQKYIEKKKREAQEAKIRAQISKKQSFSGRINEVFVSLVNQDK